jgi:putative peptide modification system cyclase
MDLAAPPQLGTLLLCDLVDSTALVERMGDRQAADLLRRHDRIARDLMQVHHGQEIDKTDGFLVLFERPVHAVAFALDYQRALKALSKQERTPLRTRVGIHTGEILSWENAPDDVAHGANRVEIEGLVKPVAARLMSLALPDQILLSSITYALALRAQSELTGFGDTLRWKAHGDYYFKGVPEPMAVVEVGEKGLGPFHHPPSSAKAHRILPWWRRPAALAAEAGALLLVVGVVLYMQFVSPPAIAFAERDWVVVSDLRNLTGQSILDDSLDAAFRVGLEQSRFVNVLPDLQMRDALQRMEREPGTRVDRSIAAEIAQREGARAVVAPSISEVGGRVRFTVEVIEPRSGRTAYSESADGRGLESSLGSVDRVLRRMRARLGESLERIEADSEPLEQVTSGNLEALKAYSLAIRAASQGDGRQSLALLQRAVELDPGFASAHAKLAAYYLQAGNGERTLHHLRAAEAERERLIPRDRLYVDGHLAALLTPDRMLERWSQLANLYPDFHAGQNNYALFLWIYENRFEEAIRPLQEVVASRHPYRGIAANSLSTMRLALGDFDGAAEADAVALASGVMRAYFVEINTAAARRDYARAEAILAEADPRGFGFGEVELPLRAATLYADCGRLAEAAEQARRAAEAGLRQDLPGGRQRARLVELYMDARLRPTELAGRIAAYIAEERRRIPAEGPMLDASAVSHLMLAGLVAARAGELALAEEALAAARPRVEGEGFRDRELLYDALRAEILLAQGDAEAALARLQPWIGQREAFQTRVVAYRAALAAGRDDEAAAHAGWLLDRRGQAFAEYVQQFAAQALNVMDGNEVQLALAEAAHAAGEHARAAQLAAPLAEAWRQADPGYTAAARLRALLELLEEA